MTKLSPVEAAPRYTSYPTAPHFHAGVNGGTLRSWLREVDADEPLSLYLHIPYCDRLCWFCACHTRHTLRYQPVADYLEVLLKEIELVAGHLHGRGRAGAVHLGGGSPTMLKPGDLKRLIDRLRSSFQFEAGAEIAIEIDPSDVDPARLDSIASVGTTRASLGVQDFDQRVQKAINREQGFELTRDILEGLRQRGVGSVNLDLVYGLPHQTVDSVAATVSACLALKPDRLALFGYAHVPWFKKHQTMIDESVLPGAEERLAQARHAAELIENAGYEAVGLDHFALPNDALAVAAREGSLRRNFQGYTTDRCATLIGLGASSIGVYRHGYTQNVVALGDYARAVNAGELPVARGCVLDDEDRMRGWVIERLMCDFGFSTSALIARFGAVARDLLSQAADIAAIEPEWLSQSGDRYEVPAPSRAFVRLVASRFDAYLDTGTARHSLAV